DQSYFLYPIKKENLKFLLFPLGEFTKEEVIKIAEDIGLPNVYRPQSQDICFISGDYRKFLIKKVDEFTPGEILDTRGNILGKHRGIFFYTIGQRERLGISASSPFYVVSIDAYNNRIIVGKRKDLLAKGLVAQRINILVDNLPYKASAKIRYQHRPAVCFLYPQKDKMKVIFKEKQSAITPGQSVVFYKKDTLLGGGVITQAL
ncbi:MAG: tRNA 2-thiouridine(34) synthase MnmA, partial [Candidatus Omnitrophica bacterium]|nr:tRNA 2-thiouridine(34) synthase MnmA [Candidatus Omnitrophota bacterium]